MSPLLSFIVLSLAGSQPLMKDGPSSVSVMPCDQKQCKIIQIKHPLYYLDGNPITDLDKLLKQYTLSSPAKPQRISGFVKGDNTMIGLNFKWDQSDKGYRISNTMKVAEEIDRQFGLREKVLIQIRVKTHTDENNLIRFSWFEETTVHLD